VKVKHSGLATDNIQFDVDNIVSHGHHQTPMRLLGVGLQDNGGSRSFGIEPYTMEKVARGVG
jgi:hypothetical protein